MDEQDETRREPLPKERGSLVRKQDDLIQSDGMIRCQGERKKMRLRAEKCRRGEHISLYTTWSNEVSCLHPLD